jgi:hypothetical protein
VLREVAKTVVIEEKGLDVIRDSLETNRGIVAKTAENSKSDNPHFDKCSTFQSAIDEINSSLSNYQHTTKVIEDSLDLIIGSLAKMGILTSNLTSNTEPKSNLKSLYEKGRAQIQYITNRKKIVERYTRILKESSIQISKIKQKSDIKFKQIEILSANIKFDLFRTEYNTFYFNSGRYKIEDLRIEDRNQLKRDMNSLFTLWEKLDDDPNLKIKVVILAFGYADLTPLSDELIKEISPERKLTQEEANQLLSELRAKTTSEYIINQLGKSHQMEKEDFELCYHGLGTKEPDIDVNYQHSKDPRRRVVKCFYHVIAAEK